MTLFEKIWKIINSPLMVVLIALSIWPLLSAFTIHKAVSKITADTIESVTEAFQNAGGNDNDIRDFLEFRDKIEITFIKKVHSDWKNKEKFIATIVNKHNKSIKKLVVNLSFYNEEDELVDVTDNLWLSVEPILQPNESYNFSFSREIGSLNEDEKELDNRKSKKVILKVKSAELYN